MADFFGLLLIMADFLGLAVQNASAFWGQQPLAAREHASTTIIPACDAVEVISICAKDLIEKEVSAFYQGLDNSPYMLPSTPQVCKRNVFLKLFQAFHAFS